MVPAISNAAVVSQEAQAAFERMPPGEQARLRERARQAFGLKPDQFRDDGPLMQACCRVLLAEGGWME